MSYPGNQRCARGARRTDPDAADTTRRRVASQPATAVARLGSLGHTELGVMETANFISSQKNRIWSMSPATWSLTQSYFREPRLGEGLPQRRERQGHVLAVRLADAALHLAKRHEA